jgi:hypothetical protein
LTNSYKNGKLAQPNAKVSKDEKHHTSCQQDSNFTPHKSVCIFLCWVKFRSPPRLSPLPTILSSRTKPLPTPLLLNTSFAFPTMMNRGKLSLFVIYEGSDFLIIMLFAIVISHLKLFFQLPQKTHAGPTSRRALMLPNHVVAAPKPPYVFVRIRKTKLSPSVGQCRSSLHQTRLQRWTAMQIKAPAPPWTRSRPRCSRWQTSLH